MHRDCGQTEGQRTRLAYNSTGKVRAWPVWLLVWILLSLTLLSIGMHFRSELGRRLSAPERAAAVAGVVTDVVSQPAGIRLDLFDTHRRQKLRLYAYPGNVASAPGSPHALIAPAPGEYLEGVADLRPVVGYANPWSFRYALWALGQGINATGVLRSFRTDPTRSDPSRLALAKLRATVALPIENPELRQAALLGALLYGQTQAVAREDWSVLARTGTLHLFVVSGLHVGVMCGAGFWLFNALARLLPWLTVRLPAVYIARTGAALASLIYLAVTGVAVPVLRATITTWCVLLVYWCRRRLQPHLLLPAVLWLVIAVLPGSVAGQGLWMSFSAVAALLAHFGYRRERHSGLPGVLSGFLRAQWVVSLALIPALVSWTHFLPVHAIPINLLFVPLITLLVLPMAVVGVLGDLLGVHLASRLLQLADSVLDRALAVLHWCASGPDPIALSLSAGRLWFLVCAICAVLLPLPLRQRATLWLCLVLLLMWPRTPLPSGVVVIDVLDVGQGSAAIVRTRMHTLVFDTGPAYAGGFALAEAVVEPMLARYGVEPDVIAVSHRDRDHAGGLHYLQQRYSAARVLVPDAAEHLSDAAIEDCLVPRQFSWDGVEFNFLSAHAAKRSLLTSPNDRSCVLRINAGPAGALLMGDGSRKAEYLLPRGELHRVNLLLAPHHGSQSSSSPWLLARTQPDVVAISAGRFNAYGHPHASVLQRIISGGARVSVTGCHGMLSWDSRRPGQLSRWRETDARWWHHQDAVSCSATAQ